MRARSIRKHLRPSKVMDRRTTITHAFASALAPFDEYVAGEVAEALDDLEQPVDCDLVCVYCGALARTWDHVFNRVVNGSFSGHGHRIRNLVPCCRDCNESKVNKGWQEFLAGRSIHGGEERVRRMERFLAKAGPAPAGMDAIAESSPVEIARYLAIKSEIFDLMAEADRLAAVIRARSSP